MSLEDALFPDTESGLPDLAAGAALRRIGHVTAQLRVFRPGSSSRQGSVVLYLDVNCNKRGYVQRWTFVFLSSRLIPQISLATAGMPAPGTKLRNPALGSCWDRLRYGNISWSLLALRYVSMKSFHFTTHDALVNLTNVDVPPVPYRSNFSNLATLIILKTHKAHDVKWLSHQPLSHRDSFLHVTLVRRMAYLVDISFVGIRTSSSAVSSSCPHCPERGRYRRRGVQAAWFVRAS